MMTRNDCVIKFDTKKSYSALGNMDIRKIEFGGSVMFVVFQGDKYFGIESFLHVSEVEKSSSNKPHVTSTFLRSADSGI